ncbi:unnamed protein product, partial [Prorocentrum cordatum]
RRSALEAERRRAGEREAAERRLRQAEFIQRVRAIHDRRRASEAAEKAQQRVSLSRRGSAGTAGSARAQACSQLDASSAHSTPRGPPPPPGGAADAEARLRPASWLLEPPEEAAAEERLREAVRLARLRLEGLGLSQARRSQEAAELTQLLSLTKDSPNCRRCDLLSTDLSSMLRALRRTCAAAMAAQPGCACGGPDGCGVVLRELAEAVGNVSRVSEYSGLERLAAHLSRHSAPGGASPPEPRRARERPA